EPVHAVAPKWKVDWIKPACNSWLTSEARPLFRNGRGSVPAPSRGGVSECAASVHFDRSIDPAGCKGFAGNPEVIGTCERSCAPSSNANLRFRHRAKSPPVAEARGAG